MKMKMKMMTMTTHCRLLLHTRRQRSGQAGHLRTPRATAGTRVITAAGPAVITRRDQLPVPRRLASPASPLTAAAPARRYYCSATRSTGKSSPSFFDRLLQRAQQLTRRSTPACPATPSRTAASHCARARPPRTAACPGPTCPLRAAGSSPRLIIETGAAGH